MLPGTLLDVFIAMAVWRIIWRNAEVNCEQIAAAD